MQMMAAYLPEEALQSEGRPPSETCGDLQMQDTDGMVYLERSIKLNGDYDGKEAALGNSADDATFPPDEPLQEADKHNLTQGDQRERRADDSRVGRGGLQRAASSRLNLPAHEQSELHRPSTILNVSEGQYGLFSSESLENNMAPRPSQAHPLQSAIVNEHLMQGLFANAHNSSQASGTMTPHYPQIAAAGQSSLKACKSPEKD